MSFFLPPLAAWLAATVLPLGALWLLFRVALRPERCFGYNRALLLLAPLVAAGLPLLPRPAVPFWPWPGAASAVGGAAGAAVLLPTVPVAGGAGPAGWAGWPWLLGLYGAGVALGLARLGWQRWQLRRATRALRREKRDGYVLARTAGRLPTSSFGRTIFWDETADLSPPEAASVLAHERAHVRQGHTYDVLWLEAWRAVLWPNPFAHQLLPALRLTHELLADREAAALLPTLFEPAEAPTPPPYPALLARLAVRGVAGPAYSALLQPFTFSFTLARLAMLQNQTPVRRWKQWLALPVLGGLSLVACQPTSVPPGPPPSNLVEPATPLTFFSAEQKEARRARVREALRNDSVQHVGQDMSGERQTVLFMDDGTVRVTWGPKSPQRLPPGVYTFVEQMPELPGGGGYAAIMQALQANLVHPSAAALGVPGTGNTSVRLEGRVLVSFTVGANGMVRDANVVKALSPAYDAAVLAAVHKLPRFTPGQQAGKPVAVHFLFPVQFAQ